MHIVLRQWAPVDQDGKNLARFFSLEPAMTTTSLPDRLSTNPKSPYYDEALLSRGVGIRFDGQEKTNVEEYCVSEGWIRVAVGRTVDRKGNPLTIKLSGKVEPYLQK
jgi:hypothetical protein